MILRLFLSLFYKLHLVISSGVILHSKYTDSGYLVWNSSYSEFYAEFFETLQMFWSWSENVHSFAYNPQISSWAVLLLWIFYVFVLSCVWCVSVHVCLYVLCGHLLGKGWPLGSRLWCLLWVCHFPIGILGQVRYLIVSFPDLCTLTYFVTFFTSWV